MYPWAGIQNQIAGLSQHNRVIDYKIRAIDFIPRCSIYFDQVIWQIYSEIDDYIPIILYEFDGQYCRFASLVDMQHTQQLLDRGCL